MNVNEHARQYIFYIFIFSHNNVKEEIVFILYSR